MDIKISLEQAKIFEALLIQNRESAKLQKLSECSYLESINHLNDLRKKVLNAHNNQNDSDIKRKDFETELDEYLYDKELIIINKYMKKTQ